MSPVVLFAFSAALAFALGNILQKSGMNRENYAPPHGFREWTSRLLRSPFWLVGIGFSCVGALLQYYSMAHWNISLVQPLIGINPVLTAVLGWLLLKERVAVRVWVALLFAVIGIVFMGMIGEERPGVLNEGVWIAAGVIAAVMALLHLIKRGSGEMRYALASGLGFGLSVVFYKMVVLSLGTVIEENLSVLLLALLRSPAVWAYAAIYTASFFFSQAALAQGRASVVIPLSSLIGSALPVLAGLFLFGEPLCLFKGIGMLSFATALLLFFSWGRRNSVAK